MDFKYNEELTQTFMSSNQIGGFFNRLEASRKYLFGSMGVLGQTNDSIITGVLIARGQDIKPVVEVAPDWESYEYKRLDLNNADDKAFFEAALAWDLEVNGKKWVDGKLVSTPLLPSRRLPCWATGCNWTVALTTYVCVYSSSKRIGCWICLDVSFTLLSLSCHHPACVVSPGACCVVAVSRNAKRIVKSTRVGVVYAHVKLG